MLSRRLAALFALSLFVPACVADRVRSLGAVDLQCPESRVNVQSAASGDEYVAVGCGKWVAYECIRGTCFPRPAPRVHVVRGADE